MWTCLNCNRDFLKSNQYHSCNDKSLADFLKGRSTTSIELFEHFIEEYKRIGDISIHPTKSMISISAKKGMAYITRLGKNFIDIVFPFSRPFDENLCFVKIKQVPGSQQYNHHFRMLFKEDINKEVKHYMKLAFENAN